jgi:hypothetical protein
MANANNNLQWVPIVCGVISLGTYDCHFSFVSLRVCDMYKINMNGQQGLPKRSEPRSEGVGIFLKNNAIFSIIEIL